MIMTFAESPMAEQVPAAHRDKVIHARIAFGDQVLMGSDAPPDRYEPMKGFLCIAASRDSRRRSGKDLQGAFGERLCVDADTKDLLGRARRRAYQL